jgi:uncharacterized damage-inducible protein DinB
MRAITTLITPVCLLLGALGASAAAQIPDPKPPVAKTRVPSDPILRDLIRDWVAQRDRLLAVAEAMPGEKYDYRATEPQRTFGEQLHHLAQAHVGMLKPLDQAGHAPVPALEPGTSKVEVMRALTAAYTYGEAVLLAIDGPASAPAGDVTRARVVWAAMNNAMNHYGQLVVYLRLNGIVPPASRR